MCLNALFESDLNRGLKRESNRITAPHNAVLEVRVFDLNLAGFDSSFKCGVPSYKTLEACGTSTVFF